MAGLPGAIKAMAPSAEVDQFTDDLTVCPKDTTVEEAARKMQPALNAIEIWAKENEWEIAADKTEVVVISLDPRETAGKAVPEADDGQHKNQIGETSDNSWSFHRLPADLHESLPEHGEENLEEDTSTFRVGGKNWGIVSNDLRSVYCSYVRPG